MNKGIKNAKVVVHKLELTLIRATNHKLKFINKKKQKREEMVKEKNRSYRFVYWKKNYESDTRDKINLHQTYNKYLL